MVTPAKCIPALAILLVGIAGAVVAEENPKTIKLFNQKNLDGWIIHTREKQSENPGIFTVKDGILKISGGAGDEAYYGGIITEKEYENYHFVLEYKWGGPTFGTRKDKARDSGILLHCVGPVGGPGGKGPWMTSVECQIIEGGTGDFIMVGGPDNDGNPVKHSATVNAEKRDGQWYYNPEAPEVTISGARINWWGRDPKWKDVVDFRGEKDVESPFGEWTRVECICKGNTVTNIVNGKVVNKGTNFALSKGKILVQTEGAEMYVRKIELTPLD